MKQLSADDLIFGYINGIFPMADSQGELYWYSPDPRAIIPIASFKPPKSLKKTIEKGIFEVRIDADFKGVIDGCSLPRNGNEETWISQEIKDAYSELHQLGFAHSVETYIGNRLVGGLYGVSIGGAFFGESMFHTESEASKVAFVYLIETLKEKNFQLLDTQFINDNVKRFGAVEIPREEYILKLGEAMKVNTRFSEKEVDHLFKVSKYT